MATRVIAGYRPRRAGAADGFLRWRVVDRVGDRVVERLFNRVFDRLPHMPGRARTYGRDITRRRQERAAWADAYRASFGARRGEHGCAICHARRTVRDARGAGYMAPCHVARFPRAAGRVERVERPASEAADGSPGPPLPFGTCNGATACGAGPGPCASPEGGRVSRGATAAATRRRTHGGETRGGGWRVIDWRLRFSSSRCDRPARCVRLIQRSWRLTGAL